MSHPITSPNRTLSMVMYCIVYEKSYLPLKIQLRCHTFPYGTYLPSVSSIIYLSTIYHPSLILSESYLLSLVSICQSITSHCHSCNITLSVAFLANVDMSAKNHIIKWQNHQSHMVSHGYNYAELCLMIHASQSKPW